MEEGLIMYDLMQELFPICRSITGDGVRETLSIIKREVPEMQIYEVPSGTKVFDWTIPLEWNIKGGGIWKINGDKIIDFQDNNLHIMGYSIPVDKIVDKDELNKYIYTLPDQPQAIPYVTSYYKERFGFCMSEIQKRNLTEDYYHIKIDSELKSGSLTYGEVVIPGKTKEEVFFSTYVCHPSMANNELSGPVLATELIKYIKKLKDLRYTYRFIFIPETIGSITYISKHLSHLKKYVKCAFNLTCVGDDRTYSYIESPYANTLADRVALNVLNFNTKNYKRYPFLNRGSNERQYCSPLVNLPMVVICRSKFEEYPEYHTSLDTLDRVVTPKGLQGSYDIYTKCINVLEWNKIFRTNTICEPQLGKRNLYPSISMKGSNVETHAITDFLAYADGFHDLIDISNKIGKSVELLIPVIKLLLEVNLISIKH